jgi:hypothetical protein
VKKRSELMLWKTEKILIQGISKWWKLYWRTRNFKEVFIPETQWVKIWDLVDVKIEKIIKWALEWVVA